MTVPTFTELDRITVELRRHSLKDGTHRGRGRTIGPQGRKLGRIVGGLQLRGRNFHAAYVSPRPRTHQTFWEFAHGAGDFDLTHVPAIAPIYVEEKRMRPFYEIADAAERRGEDKLRAILASNRALVLEMAENMAGAFRRWIEHEVAPGTNILIVGHSPELEMIALGLGHGPIPNLEECEGYRLIYRHSAEARPPHERYVLEHRMPGLDPRALRDALGSFQETDGV